MTEGEYWLAVSSLLVVSVMLLFSWMRDFERLTGSAKRESCTVTAGMRSRTILRRRRESDAEWERRCKELWNKMGGES